MKTNKNSAKTQKPTSNSAKLMSPGEIRAIDPKHHSEIKKLQENIAKAQSDLGRFAFLALQADTNMRQAAKAFEDEQAKLRDFARDIITKAGQDVESNQWNIDFDKLEFSRLQQVGR